MILLIGTAHISKESVDLVRESIVLEIPDRFCLEPDRERYWALPRKEIIRQSYCRSGGGRS